MKSKKPVAINALTLQKLKDTEIYKKEFEKLSKETAKLLTDGLEKSLNKTMKQKDFDKLTKLHDEYITRLAELEILIQISSYKKDLKD